MKKNLSLLFAALIVSSASNIDAGITKNQIRLGALGTVKGIISLGSLYGAFDRLDHIRDHIFNPGAYKKVDRNPVRCCLGSTFTSFIFLHAAYYFGKSSIQSFKEAKAQTAKK